MNHARAACRDCKSKLGIPCLEHSAIPAPMNGTQIEYLPVNNAYMITWGNMRAHVWGPNPSRAEAIREFRRVTGQEG